MTETGPRGDGAPPAVGSRIGSFELADPAGSWSGQARFQARGAAGTAHDGVAALVVVSPIAGDDGDLIGAATARLNAIAALRHDCLLPIVEAGAWEGGLYLAHSLSGSETLAGRVARAGAYGATEAGAVVDGLAAALDAAAAAGVPHGDVRLDNVWLGDKGGQPLLGGFVITPNERLSAANDAAGLAAILASLLVGRQIDVARDDASPAPAWDSSLGLPAVVREAVGRGFGPDLARRYPSAGSLAAAYRESIAEAAAIQVAGAWEAIERRDYPMAQMLCEAALRLRGSDYETEALLQHLRSNLGDGATALPALGFGIPSSPVPPPPAGSVAGASPAALASQSGSGEPLSDLSTLPPELAELLAVPPQQPLSGTNAWLTLASGMVVLIAVTLVVAFLAISYR